LKYHFLCKLYQILTLCVKYLKIEKPFILINNYIYILWGQLKIEIMLLYLHNKRVNDNHLCQITNNYKDYVMAIFDNVENALKFHLTVFTDGRPHFVVKEHSASDCCYWHTIIFTSYSIRCTVFHFFFRNYLTFIFFFCVLSNNNLWYLIKQHKNIPWF